MLIIRLVYTRHSKVQLSVLLLLLLLMVVLVVVLL